ncbi:preprotein translocase subunit YajC [bacterium]|nr:preprotein translocase subunit YajC [bacterium]
MAAPQTEGQGSGNFLLSLLPILLIFGVFYLLLIRPQQKKQKSHMEMLNALQKGDKVITSGGLKGTVVGVKDNEIVVRIAKEVTVEVEKSYIVQKEER